MWTYMISRFLLMGSNINIKQITTKYNSAAALEIKAAAFMHKDLSSAKRRAKKRPDNQISNTI